MSDYIKLPPEARPNWMEEIDRLTAENQRLQAGVDAARGECQTIIRGADIALSSPQAELSTSLVWVTEMETAKKILRALDGEVKP